MRIARIRTPFGPAYAGHTADGWRTVGEPGDDIVSLAEKGAPVPSGAPVSTQELLCPVVRPAKVIAIGLNYLDHIRETGATSPQQPVVFAKFPNSLVGPQDPIVIDPQLTNEVDYEIELAVVIGRSCRSVPTAAALDVVFGYTIANDVSPRDLQRTDPQLSWAKSVDGFCPIGPWITTADEIEDPQALAIRSFVNAEPRQSSTTGEMLFSVAELIAFLTRTMTLSPGDVILTGTPHGVGFTMSPPRFLAVGDTVRGEIEKLGYLENRVIESPRVASA